MPIRHILYIEVVRLHFEARVMSHRVGREKHRRRRKVGSKKRRTHHRQKSRK